VIELDEPVVPGVEHPDVVATWIPPVVIAPDEVVKAHRGSATRGRPDHGDFQEVVDGRGPKQLSNSLRVEVGDATDRVPVATAREVERDSARKIGCLIVDGRRQVGEILAAFSQPVEISAST
jgi:hypothetical protein